MSSVEQLSSEQKLELVYQEVEKVNQEITDLTAVGPEGIKKYHALLRHYEAIAIEVEIAHLAPALVKVLTAINETDQLLRTKKASLPSFF
jgi:hypothetical protein